MTQKLCEQLPQIDRVCITYVEDGKLRLWRRHEENDFKGPLRSTTTRIAAKGQALADFAQRSEPQVVNDLKAAGGSAMRQMASHDVKSSLHLPIEAHGRRGTLNFWSTDAQAFPPEAVKWIESLRDKLGTADPLDLIARRGADNPDDLNDTDE